MRDVVRWGGVPLYLLVVHPGYFSFGGRNKTRGVALLGTSLLSNSHETTMKMQSNRRTRLLTHFRRLPPVGLLDRRLLTL